MTHANKDLAQSITRHVTNKLNDKVFINNAEINLLLHEKDRIIRRKLTEYARILETISILPRRSYVVIKVRPFISNLWNDVDVLISKEELPHIISALKRLGIDKITGRKRGALTVFLKNTTLRVDLYTHIGWRGLRYLEVDFARLSEEIGVYTVDNRRIEIYVLPQYLDLALQIMHVFASGTMSLASLLKLIFFENVNKEENELNLKLYINLDVLIKVLKHAAITHAQELFKRGCIKLSINPVVEMCLIFNNLKNRIFNFRGYYYEFKNIIYRLLVKGSC
jgi:hypothetical protein